jgi:integrase
MSPHVPSSTALAGLRIALYTGCRHRAELLAGDLTWFKEDLGIRRLEIPRAKGDRRRGQGRFLYLGPHAVHLLRTIARPAGSLFLVPGRLAGQHLYRLNETWDAVLTGARSRLRDLQAASPTPLDTAVLGARIWPGETGDRVPVKVFRHTAKTIHPRAGIAPEHSAQLLGHEAATLGERVYLHHHGPSLVQAATIYERFVRQLLGGVIPVRSGDTPAPPSPWPSIPCRA